MSVPWAKRLSGRADVYGFPVTNGPLMLLLPNRAGVPIYGQPRPTVVMMQPPVAPLPPPPVPRPPVPPLAVVFHNAEQTCVNTCPEGTTGEPISVTVPANEYSSEVSQEAANAAAMAAACAQAAAERELNPCIVPPTEGFSLWGAGSNDFGTLGINSEINQLGMVAVDYNPQYKAIATGDRFTIGIRHDGTLWAWGRGLYTAQGPLQFFDPAFAAEFAVFNLIPYPIQVGTDSDWVSVSAGLRHWIAIKEDGRAFGAGENGDSQLGFPVGIVPNDDVYYLPTEIPITDCAMVSCGQKFSLIVKTDGTLWETGETPNGGPDLTAFTQVGTDTNWASASSGAGYAMLLKVNGALYAYGANPLHINNAALGLGPLGDAPTPQQVGSDLYTMAVAGVGVTAAIRIDGTLWTCGGDGTASGCLGLGNTNVYDTLQQVGALNTWTRIVTSCVSPPLSIGQLDDGTMWGFGDNSQGALGFGVATGIELSPTQVGSDEKWEPLFATAGKRAFYLRTDQSTPAPVNTDNVAYGGAYSEAGGFSIHTFGTSGQLIVYVDTAMEWLLAGGGGGGGGVGAGGGGEVILGSGIIPAGTYEVVIGNAGTAGFNQDRGGDGSSTVFNGNTAAGGGGGGGYETFAGTNKDGRDGACGGGSGMDSSVAGIPGNGTVGFDGGTGVITVGGQGIAGGAGGGMTGIGGNGSGTDEASGTGGTGGAGTTSAISGTSKVYGAGGGGGGWTTAGAGGSSGIGGKGSTRTTQTPSPVSYGKPNTGSGGGGGFGSFQFAGKGAEGVFIIRYLTPP